LFQPRPMAGTNRLMRPNGQSSSAFAAEYDDPANCDHYNDVSHNYASYTNTQPHPPPPHEFSTNPNTMMARRSLGPVRNVPLPPYPDPPQPPLPPPRTANDSVNMSSSSNNDSTVSAEISEAECDREHLVNRNYGGKSTFFRTIRLPTI